MSLSPYVDYLTDGYISQQMSEADFWVQFFQSQKFHRDRNKSSNKSSTVFEDCLQQDLVCEFSCSLPHYLVFLLFSFISAVSNQQSSSSGTGTGLLPSTEIPSEVTYWSRPSVYVFSVLTCTQLNIHVHTCMH